MPSDVSLPLLPLSSRFMSSDALRAASSQLPSASRSGPAGPTDPARRQHCRRLAAGVLALTGLAGCGGGGGGGGSSGTGGTGGASVAPGNTPPARGSFGGGQGKLLFVQSGDFPQVVREFDLATRQVRDLVTIARSRVHRLVGGVSRANDGSFLVTDYISTSFDDMGVYHHCAADGSVLKSIASPIRLTEGAVISPDARLAAYAVNQWITGSRYELRVLLTQLATAEVKAVTLLSNQDEPSDWESRPVMARAIWAPDGTLYVAARFGLFRVDPGTGAVSRLLTFELPDFTVPTISPDGRRIWFQGAAGTGYPPAIWSIDIASGVIARRTDRSRTGMQYAPVVSPDGNWLAMQQLRSEWTGIGTREFFVISAIRVTESPVDTQDLDVRVQSSEGGEVTAGSRMVWY